MTEQTHPGDHPRREVGRQPALAQARRAALQQGGGGYLAAAPIYFEVI
jgi:hypothetical protein